MTSAFEPEGSCGRRAPSIGVLAVDHLEDFDTTMLLRETADYKSGFSREGAQSAVESAERFLTRAKEILEGGDRRA